MKSRLMFETDEGAGTTPNTTSSRVTSRLSSTLSIHLSLSFTCQTEDQGRQKIPFLSYSSFFRFYFHTSNSNRQFMHKLGVLSGKVQELSVANQCQIKMTIPQVEMTLSHKCSFCASSVFFTNSRSPVFIHYIIKFLLNYS